MLSIFLSKCTQTSKNVTSDISESFTNFPKSVNFALVPEDEKLMAFTFMNTCRLISRVQGQYFFLFLYVFAKHSLQSIINTWSNQSYSPDCQNIQGSNLVIDRTALEGFWLVILVVFLCFCFFFNFKKCQVSDLNNKGLLIHKHQYGSGPETINTHSCWDRTKHMAL